MLTLAKPFFEELLAHAREERPNECCGILAGADGRVLKLYRTNSIERSPVKYNIDPKDLYKVLKEAEAQRWELLAFYHSHTFSEAYPSPTDIRLATWPESLYLILSLQDPEQPVLRAFSIQDDQVREEKINIG